MLDRSQDEPLVDPARAVVEELLRAAPRSTPPPTAEDLLSIFARLRALGQAGQPA